MLAGALQIHLPLSPNRFLAVSRPCQERPNHVDMVEQDDMICQEAL